jgi:hypothetical protein
MKKPLLASLTLSRELCTIIFHAFSTTRPLCARRALLSDDFEYKKSVCEKHESDAAAAAHILKRDCGSSFAALKKVKV